MANTKKKTTVKEQVVETEKEIIVTEQPDIKDEKEDKPKQIKAKDVDINQYITVYNGHQGELIYKSSRTGETFEWSHFGSEQDIELKELKNAKNAHKKFFVNNWFMFDDDWVIDYLGVRAYYKNALSINSFDEIFEKSPSEVAEIISKLSPGQKRSVAYRAKQLIAEEAIDSNKLIKVLEEELGVELIER